MIRKTAGPTRPAYSDSRLKAGTSTHQWPVKLLLLAGLLVGTLDIAAACTDYYLATGKGPEGVLRYVASGVFGKSAFTGKGMAVWGLLFHFIIAYAFTFFFYWLYPRLRFLQRYPVVSAVAYGIFMWAVTTRLVLPLSNTPPAPPFVWWKAAKATGILIVMIAAPLTVIIGRHYKKGTAAYG